MKRYMTMAVVCGCLLIGSLYPKLLLEHHVKLVNTEGQEITMSGEYEDKIPIKLQLRFLEMFR